MSAIISILDRIKRDKQIFENVIIRAGNILKHYFGSAIRIDFKGQNDMVTEADLASESAIISMLREITPDIPVMSEEEFETKDTSFEHQPELIWILDPLDGTTNFAHKLPHFCISLALVANHEPIFGMIYDPIREEMFSTIKGCGAVLNGVSCSVSSVSRLSQSLVATGFPYKVRQIENNNLVEFCAFRLRSQGVRRIGAAALDLAYVACGRLDGFWERWLKPWDTAAGILLVEESGGKISHFDGSRFSIYSPQILSSNGKIHSEMLDVLNRPWPQLPQEFKNGLDV